MGYADFSFEMESRTGSVSSGRGYSPDVRGHASKSSSFYPHSSSKSTQSIVRNHMVSHYKRIYSAKAAVDTSVPKSLLQSVKYNDQIKKEMVKKKGRPQSADSFSRRHCRTSCSSAQSKLSLQNDDSRYLCSRSSMVSSPRFPTSFNAKDTVYPSFKFGPHNAYPASEIDYQSLEGFLQRKPSASSLAALREQQQSFQPFQDPVQKTYSGDLLQKHSQCFTQEKPFTPKTLKSEKSSYLSKYRFYRAPQKTSIQKCITSKPIRQETYHVSTKSMDFTQELGDVSQDYSSKHELTEEAINDSHFSYSGLAGGTTNSGDHYLLESFNRVSPEPTQSRSSKVSVEEEELMYLEFISDVAEEISSMGHISKRVIDRIMKRHVSMNLHKLNEDKMLHLLEVFKKELEDPLNIRSSTGEAQRKENEMIDALFSHLKIEETQGKSKGKDSDLSSFASLADNGGFPDHTSSLPDRTDTLLTSTPFSSPECATTSTKTNEIVQGEKRTSFPSLSENASNETCSDEKDCFEVDRTLSDSVLSEKLERDSECSVSHYSGQSDEDEEPQELDDLSKDLSTLDLSGNADSEKADSPQDQDKCSSASSSDDDF